MQIRRDVAIRQIGLLVSRVEGLIDDPADEPFSKWISDCEAFFRNVFGIDSEQLRRFRNISYSPLSWTEDTPGYVFMDARNAGLKEGRAQLAAARDEINVFWNESSGKGANRMSVKIFVSHSSRDTDLVMAMVELLKNSLDLKIADIRCTSVKGFGLSAGTAIQDRLKVEVHESAVFIAVLSESAMQSPFTLFEIGARWGSGKLLVSALAPGFEPAHLPEPVKGFHALKLSDRADVMQLVEDVGRELAIQRVDSHFWSKYVDAVLASKPQGSLSETGSHQVEVIRPSSIRSQEAEFSADAIQLLLAAASNERGEILVHDSLRNPSIRAGGKEMLEGPLPREYARWDGALDELLTQNCVKRLSNAILRLTNEGWKQAESAKQ